MRVIPKHHFLPEAPTAPFKSVPLSDLKRALLTKRLGRSSVAPSRKKVRDFFSRRYVWSRPASHPLVVRAEQWCSSELLHDLQRGRLISFTNHRGSFYRILPAYWEDQFVGLSLAGRLIDVNEGETFPAEFWGNAIFVFEEYARDWLKYRKITQDDLGFPAILRTRPPNIRAPIPSDGQILEQARSFKIQGLGRDEIAKKIRTIPGFGGVTNESVRRVIKGEFPRGRPKKPKHP